MKQIKEGKMVGYKLSKNDLVAPFFVIFRSVREKLLVTVFFDHPVLIFEASKLCTDICKTIFVILEVEFHHEGGLS